MTKYEAILKMIRGIENREIGTEIREDIELCQYRDKNGKKCAVGFWIRDECYKPEFEGRSLYRLPSGIFIEDMPFTLDELAVFQKRHDDDMMAGNRNLPTLVSFLFDLLVFMKTF